MAFVHLVTFEIAGNEYAVDINSISSIIKRKDYSVNKIPTASALIEGIINLRGKVCMLFNLEKRFQLVSEVPEIQHKIIIVQDNASIIGFIVDEVTDIYKMPDTEIEPLPFSAKGDGSELIRGIAKVDGKIILILDLIKVLASDELLQMDKILGDKAVTPA